MNLANKLTVLRMILVPFFLIFMYFDKIPYGTVIAVVIFIVASITDKLDGHIARSRNMITNFGKFMDPLADKLLVISAFISLMEYDLIPGWVIIIIIAREFAVSGLRMIAASEGVVIAAGWWGKAKTVTQMITVTSLLLKLIVDTYAPVSAFVYGNVFLNALFVYAVPAMIYISALATIISGVEYFVQNKNVINIYK